MLLVHVWPRTNLAHPDGRISTHWKGMNKRNKGSGLLCGLEEAAGIVPIAGHGVGTDVANEPVRGFFSHPKLLCEKRPQRFCPVSSSCFFCFAPAKGLQHYRM